MKQLINRGGPFIVIIALVSLTNTLALPIYSRPAEVRNNSLSKANPSDRSEFSSSGRTLRQPIKEPFGKLPLRFEANQGQSDPNVKFISHCGSNTLFLTATETVLALVEERLSAGGEPERGDAGRQAALRMKLVGANAAAQIVGLGQQAGKSNYLLGNDPRAWQANVPTFSKVLRKNVYRGIDLVYYGNQQQLEYDFVVAPRANPRAIEIEFDGATDMRRDANGDLVLITPAGEVRQHNPVIYQELSGVKKQVEGRYEIKGKHRVGFRVGSYDSSKPLVIDPVLSYSTYFGNGPSEGHAIAVDSSGNIYMTGMVGSANLPTSSDAFQRSNNGTRAAFVAKLNAAGTALIYSTYIGGDKFDMANAIAVDDAGNAYIAGNTSSSDFPTTPSAFQKTFHGSGANALDGFVTKVNAAGTALIYSTYIGGINTDFINDLAIDSAGNAYVTGTTDSPTYPTTAGAFQATKPDPYPVYTSAFVTKLDATGSSLIYSTYLSGTGDYGYDVAVDSAGNAYVVGKTASADFPTMNPIQSQMASGASLKTSDGGSSWVSLGLSSGYVLFSIAIDPTNSSNVYAGMQKVFGPGGTLFKSTDGGNSWNAANNGLASGLVPTALAIDPKNSSTLYAAATGHFYKSTDGGDNWTLKGLNSWVSFIAIDPQNTSTIYATLGRGLSKSTDGGSTWSQDSSGFPDGQASALVIDPKNTSTLYAATPSGVFKSTDAGAHWTGTRHSLFTKSLVIDPRNPSTLYAATAAINVRIQSDGRGNPRRRLRKEDKREDGVLKSTNGGASWESANAGLFEDTDTHVLAIDPINPSNIYVGTSEGLFKSADGAGLWEDTDLFDIKVQVLATDLARAGTLYAGTPLTGDAFVAKLNATGSELIYSTYLGGALDDEANRVAVDPSENAYVLGWTQSRNFPVKAGAFQMARNGYSDLFVVKLNASGSALVYSTYLGGGGDLLAGLDVAGGIAIDNAGNAYITGNTLSNNFPTANPIQGVAVDNEKDFNAFVAKISSTVDAQPKSLPKVTSVFINGKKLIVSGENFDAGAVIVVNEKEQTTSNDSTSPTAMLITKKGGKKIKPGDFAMIQVRNHSGDVSQGYRFVRPLN